MPKSKPKKPTRSLRAMLTVEQVTKATAQAQALLVKDFSEAMEHYTVGEGLTFPIEGHLATFTKH